MLAGVHYANTIFHLVFFISVSSVLLQGASITLMAKWLHVSVPERVRRKFPLDIEINENFNSELIELDVPDNSPAVGKAIVELKLPKTALIVLIHREGKYLTASGETLILGGDHLLIMADSKKTIDRVYECFGLQRTMV
jgi:potassium/hydrogen antiporter